MSLHLTYLYWLVPLWYWQLLHYSDGLWLSLVLQNDQRIKIKTFSVKLQIFQALVTPLTDVLFAKVPRALPECLFALLINTLRHLGDHVLKFDPFDVLEVLGFTVARPTELLRHLHQYLASRTAPHRHCLFFCCCFRVNLGDSDFNKKVLESVIVLYFKSLQGSVALEAGLLVDFHVDVTLRALPG